MSIEHTPTLTVKYYFNLFSGQVYIICYVHIKRAKIRQAISHHPSI